jgi:hypothetical protein
MKLKAKENISDRFGSEGFGEKRAGDIFEVEDLRGEELLKTGLVEKVEPSEVTEVKPKK